MDIALSRLRVDVGDPTCPLDSGHPQMYCQDDGAWRSLMTEFTGALIPPMLTPARTRGPRSFFVGIDTSITGIRGDARLVLPNGMSGGQYWHTGTEGERRSTVGGAAGENNQVDNVLAWTRLTMRKAFPFGFELGTNIGYLVNTSYWALGLEIRWALLEGWLSRDWWVPDIAVRGAVQTMVGDQEFSATVATVDLTISNAIIIGDAFELTPMLAGQVSWTWADTNLVDLTPGISAFAQCNPDPATPTMAGDPVCRGSGSDYNNNAVFPALRVMRPRILAGLQGRYEVFTLMGSFSIDAVPPGDISSNNLHTVPDPSDPMGRTRSLQLDRQWRVDIGVGLSY